MLDPEDFVPAVGQGIIAVEARVDDGPTLAALAALDDPTTRACAEAERAFLGRLGASCNSPLAAHATILGAAPDTLRLTRARGQRGRRAPSCGPTPPGCVTTRRAIGGELADDLLDARRS